VVYNASPLNESQAFNLAVKGMTTVGDSEEKEVYGPFPVPEVDNLRTLAFMFNVQSESSGDSRIREFGRPIVVWLIFIKFAASKILLRIICPKSIKS
jgi:hypothetical protein